MQVRVLAAGVSLPDIMARKSIHPETPTVHRAGVGSGWLADRLGDGISGVEPGQIVAALPNPRRLRGVRLPAAR